MLSGLMISQRIIVVAVATLIKESLAPPLIRKKNSFQTERNKKGPAIKR